MRCPHCNGTIKFDLTRPEMGDGTLVSSVINVSYHEVQQYLNTNYHFDQAYCDVCKTLFHPNEIYNYGCGVG